MKMDDGSESRRSTDLKRCWRGRRWSRDCATEWVRRSRPPGTAALKKHS